MLLAATLSCLTACSNTLEVFDNRFNRTEIANFTSTDFDIKNDAAARALKPTYEKYGAPQAYVFGHMSSVFDPDLSRLYGHGEVRAKLKLKTHTFWTIDGTDLTDHYTPIKTAHLIYDLNNFTNLSEILESVGTLTNRGQVFTVFERKHDNQIIVTLYKTDDLSNDTHFDSLRFYQE